MSETKKTIYYDKMNRYIRYEKDPNMPSELFAEIVPNDDEKDATVTEYWLNQDEKKLIFHYDPKKVSEKSPRAGLSILRGVQIQKERYSTNFMNTYKISVPKEWYDILLEDDPEKEATITKYFV